MKKPELVLPAGNLQKLKYAYMYGADACYCGLPDFSMRSRSTQFTFSQLKEAIRLAHKLNKKLYITINTYPHNYALKNLKKYLKKLKGLKIDAIILADTGVLNLIKKYLPKIKIHLSTQANTVNLEAVKFWHKQGIRRIVLARELSLKEIAEIKKTCPKMELEVFVHGAMCISYSGRCLLSMYMTGRDANQGECTQPCRWKYKTYYLEEGLRKNEFWPIEEGQNGTYIMNSRDLCLIDYLPKLSKLGVGAFKVEGRAKSIYYLAIVSKAYRAAINAIQNSQFTIHNYKILAKQLKNELETTHHRGFTTGFITGSLQNSQEYKTSRPKSKWQFCGVVKKFNKKTKTAFVKVHNKIEKNKLLEFVALNSQFKVKIKEIINQNGKKLEFAKLDDIIKIELPKEVPVGTVVRQKLS